MLFAYQSAAISKTIGLEYIAMVSAFILLFASTPKIRSCCLVVVARAHTHVYVGNQLRSLPQYYCIWQRIVWSRYPTE